MWYITRGGFISCHLTCASSLAAAPYDEDWVNEFISLPNTPLPSCLHLRTSLLAFLASRHSFVRLLSCHLSPHTRKKFFTSFIYIRFWYQQTVGAHSTAKRCQESAGFAATREKKASTSWKYSSVSTGQSPRAEVSIFIILSPMSANQSNKQDTPQHLSLPCAIPVLPSYACHRGSVGALKYMLQKKL